MQTIDNKLYPFDLNIYSDKLYQYPNGVKLYKKSYNPSIEESDKFNLCSDNKNKNSTDAKCICNTKKIGTIIEGLTYYTCK
jgi:hypothetical protein